MLFEIDPKFESYKERNLYYKFFAGYFFNELIIGKEKRLASFLEILKNPVFPAGQNPIGNVFNDPKKVRVTFDRHLKQDLKSEKNRGEVADILLHDHESIIAIEAKYLSNWDFKKDIIENQERIAKFVNEKDFKNIIQCLLLDERKWIEGIKQVRKKQTNYSKLEKSNLKFNFVVITWQQLAGITSDLSVKEFLTDRLKAKIGK